MFDKTRAKIETQLNDRVTNPIRTSIVIAIAAFIMAGLALIVSVVCHADR